MSDEMTTAQSSGNEAIIDQGVEEIAEVSDSEEIAEGEEELEASDEAQTEETDEEELEEGDEATDEETSEDKEALEEEIKELKKKLKLKVDGQEIEEEIDWNNEEDLVKKLQKSKAFDKKAQETATLKKEMQGLIEALQDPVKALQLLQQAGHDVDALAAGHLETRVEELSKTPEEIEREKRDKEYEELKKEKEKLLQEKEAASREKLLNEEATKIETQIMDAFKDYKGLLTSNDPKIIHDIARDMLVAMKKGHADVSVEDVIANHEKSYVGTLQSRIKALADAGRYDEIADLVGKDVFDQVRKRRVSKKRKAKTETAKQIAKETGNNSENTVIEQSDDKTSYSDFFKPY